MANVSTLCEYTNKGGRTVRKWIWTGIGVALGLLIIGVAFALGGYGDTDAQAPSNEEVKQVQMLLAKDREPGLLLAKVHASMNDLVGWGHYKDFKDRNGTAWHYWDSDASTIKSDLQKAEAIVKKSASQHSDLVKDLDNAIALVDVASETHNADALLYLHRVVSDLAQFAYGHYTDYHAFGCTNLFHGSNVAKVEQLIKSGS
jgi:hypothetical protein